MRTGRTTPAIVAAIASVVLLTACGQQDAGDGAGAGGTTPDEPATSPSPSATTSATVSPTPPPQSVVDESIALLADQLGVGPDQIEVARAIEVTWPDSSIGCSKKGMAYLQVLVNGSLVELVVAGETYEFHQGDSQPPFYCANPTDPVPAS